MQTTTHNPPVEIEAAAGVGVRIAASQNRDGELWVQPAAPDTAEDLADQDGEVTTDAEGWTYLGCPEDYPDLG